MASTTTSIVKLVPIGNPEDRMYELIAVGGGQPVRTETFTSISLNLSGQADITLGVAPGSMDQVFVLVNDDERIAAPVALVGDTLTVQVRKLIYKKTVDPLGSTSVVGAPGGVSVASSSGAVTGDTAPSGTASATTTDGNPTPGTDGGAVLSIDSIDVTVDGHHHTMNTLYQHGHTVTYIDTSLPVAASETVNLLVLYR